jgi:hypothetical protein
VLEMAHLPTREDYVEMLGRAHANAAKALAQAKQSGNRVLLLRYQLELAGWERLIERIQDNAGGAQPRASRVVFDAEPVEAVTYGTMTGPCAE